MRGTDVGPGRHRGHVGGQGDEESCRGGPGPGRRDEDDHGHRRREHARHDCTGRLEQPTRGSQHQHGGLGVRAGGAREQVVDELRGNRMDDAVVLGDDDARGRALRASRATAAGELGNQAQAERDEGQSHQPTPPDDRGPGGTRGACHGSDDLIPLVAGRWLAIRRRAGRRAGARCARAVRATSSEWVASSMRDAEVAVQLGEQRQHGGAVGRVEVAGRLIGDDQRRPMDERAGDGGALRLAARHLLGIVGEPVADADAVGQARGRAPPPRATAIPASRQGSAMLSPRVRVGSRLKNWNTKPMRSRRSRVSASSSRPVRSRPSIASRPEVGRSIAPHRWSSVDLPQPDGPISATKSPGLEGERDPAQAP